jgi:hypothetical protein
VVNGLQRAREDSPVQPKFAESEAAARPATTKPAANPAKQTTKN